MKQRHKGELGVQWVESVFVGMVKSGASTRPAGVPAQEKTDDSYQGPFPCSETGTGSKEGSGCLPEGPQSKLLGAGTPWPHQSWLNSYTASRGPS